MLPPRIESHRASYVNHAAQAVKKDNVRYIDINHDEALAYLFQYVVRFNEIHEIHYIVDVN